jgi:predicted metal-dependent hydrolase
MSDLVIRRMPFSFDASTPFAWQPNNPGFGVFCNLFTFIAVPFEKYIVKVVRQAQDRITDPAVASEAEAFLRQEAQHANAHRRHMQVLTAQYPALEKTYDNACASYDELFETEPLERHLAYIANLEATFTPMFKMVLDNRASLFTGGDPEVGSLMMWHFVEEIEHRSAGLIVCDHVVKNRWYRTKQIKHTFAHVGGISAEITRDFDEYVPFADRLVDCVPLMGSTSTLVGNRLPWKRGAGSETPAAFGTAPMRDVASMMWRLALSQFPYHNPEHQPLPQHALRWMREYDEGVDMTSFATVA